MSVTSSDIDFTMVWTPLEVQPAAGASQRIPRCLPDASQMLPRYLLDAFRCFSGASQTSCLGSRAGVNVLILLRASQKEGRKGRPISERASNKEKVEPASTEQGKEMLAQWHQTNKKQIIPNRTATQKRTSGHYGIPSSELNCPHKSVNGFW